MISTLFLEEFNLPLGAINPRGRELLNNYSKFDFLETFGLAYGVFINSKFLTIMSKVFVVTPAYCTEENRRLPLLLQTIYWVQQQTHKDYLHIVVDDGSTDSTPEVLERLSQSDPNLKVFGMENGGASAAVNYGVEQALLLDKPDYITVCHSDDVLLPESLEVRVQLASKSGAELVYTDSVDIDDKGNPLKHRRAPEYSTPDELFKALLQHRSIPYITMLWGADFFLHKLQGYDNRLRSAEDWDIALRSAKELVAMQATHATTHSVTAVKRNHKNSVHMQNGHEGTKERCYEMILRKHLNGFEYRDAITRDRERLIKFQPPKLFIRVKTKLKEVQRPKLFRNALWLIIRMRRALLIKMGVLPPKTEMDPRVVAFLKEIDKVDYGLIDDTTG